HRFLPSAAGCDTIVAGVKCVEIVAACLISPQPDPGVRCLGSGLFEIWRQPKYWQPNGWALSWPLGARLLCPTSCGLFRAGSVCVCAMGKPANSNLRTGIAGVTTPEYEATLEADLLDLRERIKAGRYKAAPARATPIPTEEDVTRGLV